MARSAEIALSCLVTNLIELYNVIGRRRYDNSEEGNNTYI